MAEKILSLQKANIYQGKSLILQDVNISIDKGEFVYLVGKTGTGKSSLLKTLYGELPLTEGEGEVVYDVVDGASADARRKEAHLPAARHGTVGGVHHHGRGQEQEDGARLRGGTAELGGGQEGEGDPEGGVGVHRVGAAHDTEEKSTFMDCRSEAGDRS